MSGVLRTVVVVMGMVVSCWCQQLYFEPVPGECRKFQFTFYSYSSTFQCPDGTAFSTFSLRCVPEFSWMNNQCPILRTMSDIENICTRCLEEGAGVDCVFASPTKCNTYINCSKAIDNDPLDNLPPYVEECEYPNLFNAMARRCEDYTNVNCGQLREEAKHPCDYEKNQCGRGSHCKPCVYRFASCVDRRDGIQEWEGRSWTPYFAECQGGRTLNSGVCSTNRNGSPRIFNLNSNRCDDLQLIPRKFGGLMPDEEQPN